MEWFHATALLTFAEIIQAHACELIGSAIESKVGSRRDRLHKLPYNRSRLRLAVSPPTPQLASLCKLILCLGS